MKSLVFKMSSGLALSVAALVAQSTVWASPVQLLVPAYFYPSSSGSDWEKLTTAALSGTPITAIMNPGSGSGTGPNSDYQREINRFRSAGGRVLGYVPSGYAGANVNASSTCQPAAGSAYQVSDVLSCAAGYKSWYRVDGIFVDEMTNSSSASDLNFYQTLYAGLKNLDSAWEVVGNPGSPTQSVYLNNGANRSADSVVVFENNTGYLNYTPSAWNASVASRSIAHLGYDVADQATALTFLNLAVQRNAGYVYFTDDGANASNPWDRLPIYWEAEAAAVKGLNAASVPLPSGVWLVLMGLLFIATPTAKRLGLRHTTKRFAQFV
jgi:hypothetical protein